MRPIDADECEKYFYDHMTDDAIVGAMNAIDEMPTIEPKPGKWIKDPICGWHICSNCGKCSPSIFGEIFKYCPNCGAKMESQ